MSNFGKAISYQLKALNGSFDSFIASKKSFDHLYSVIRLLDEHQMLAKNIAGAKLTLSFSRKIQYLYIGRHLNRNGTENNQIFK